MQGKYYFAKQRRGANVNLVQPRIGMLPEFSGSAQLGKTLIFMLEYHLVRQFSVTSFRIMCNNYQSFFSETLLTHVSGSKLLLYDMDTPGL